MTCAECAERVPAWVAGTLRDDEARAVEAHAAECVACGALLEATKSGLAFPPQIAPPADLRAVTLAMVQRQRVLARWRRAAMSVAGIAAIALVVIMTRPATKSASDFPGAGKELLAMAKARPEFAALDAAEQDVVQALRDHPQDTDLLEAQQRIRRQREALQQLVHGAPE